MIRIHKPKDAPQKLLVEGKKKRRSHCSSYTRDPGSYQAGAKKFEFDRNLYSHETVKQALINAQKEKCCFCERLIGTDGDVEHFRPKGAVKQANRSSLQCPGYYWLAYEWDNLYLACPGCNQRHKQNLFPLQNPTDRATEHRQKIERENPLFIDPGSEDPEAFIGFRAEICFAIDGNPKGQATIEALKLNAKERSLPKARFEHLETLKLLHSLVKKAGAQPENVELQELAIAAKNKLFKAVQANAQFASATRWAVQTDFRFIENGGLGRY